MFEKILFTTDFSAYAKKTLDCIAGFPGVRDVILFHVIEKARSPRGGGEISDTFFQTGENNFLKEEKHHLENLSQNLRVTIAVKTSSDIAGAIIETAEEKGVSLIVIGARGNSLVEGILLGSVSMAVLRRSRTNLLIMRHKIIEEMMAKTYQMFCPMILLRVLCPIDFSRYSDNAIALLSRTRGVREVILLHVVSQGETESEIEDAIQKAKDKTEGIRSCLATQGIEVRTVVKTGNPAFEITRIADEEDVSVIWMSSHGKGWFRELLLGSTAYTVAMNAKRPVIIIRKPE
ncbi:MAG: universal stress protein [Methanoregula sp.]|jgi:nucleotide-binding universal stress UspA family protein